VHDTLYTVRDLTKSYGGPVILDGLDFEVHRKEGFVILGRSGSGKSVTLRQLNGLERPDRGSVLFDGIELTELSEHELYPVRRRVSMLFQSGALFDSMTVFNNIAFPMREHTDLEGAELETKVEEKLAMVDLEGIGDRMPSDLSGGMKKRVALARSLALDPEVVLFDEPTTGLDPVTSASIGALILRIREELGVTAIVVTHDISLARRVGTRISFLHQGDFLFVGTWEEADCCADPLFGGFLAGRDEESLDVA